MLLLMILALYLFTLILIGSYGGGKVKAAEGFFVADRKLGVFATASTLSATTIGGSATIVTTAFIYSRGLVGVWLDLAGGIGLIGLGLLWARQVRGMGVVTLPEVAARMYDEKVKVVAAILVVLTEIAWLALLIQACQTIITATTPLPPFTSLVAVAIVIILYTLVGGQYGVAYSDILQFSLMIIGICFIVAPLSLLHARGLSPLPRLALSMVRGYDFGIMDLISIILLTGLPHMVGSDIYGKLLSARDVRVARRASILAGGAKIIFGIAIAVIGLSCWKILPQLADPASALPRMIIEVIPSPLIYIVFLALLATMMSSADSVLLTASTVFSNDLMARVVSQKRLLLLSRICVGVFGGLGLLLAVHLQSIIETFRLSYTIFTAGLIIPILAGFYRHRLKVKPSGAVASMVGGGGATIIGQLFFHYRYSLLVGLALGLLLLFTVSFLGRRQRSS
ncbi:MAG: sodium:solute symporter family protein [Candidatus Aminicenantes bacterium]|nr:sodium:solute symporter family protein [Candidatus Aminicenantes bacterium]MDH5715372.1 sodium:solute symporter family protein [Candidatus Aminicenantes bacterium]